MALALVRAKCTCCGKDVVVDLELADSPIILCQDCTEAEWEEIEEFLDE